MTSHTTEEKIYNYTFRLLGMKAYSEFELCQKIKRRFKTVPTEEIDKILEKLKELKYIDDLQFAQNYLHYRTQVSPRGIFLLKRELHQKGVAEEFIQQALCQSDIDEVALARELAQHKSKALQNYEPPKQREKLMRFLQSRGFGYDVIKEVVSS